MKLRKPQSAKICKKALCVDACKQKWSRLVRTCCSSPAHRLVLWSTLPTFLHRLFFLPLEIAYHCLTGMKSWKLSWGTAPTKIIPRFVPKKSPQKHRFVDFSHLYLKIVFISILFWNCTNNKSVLCAQLNILILYSCISVIYLCLWKKTLDTYW